MDLSKILKKRSRSFIFFMLLLGGVNSLLYTAILALIDHSIGSGQAQAGNRNWMLFAGMVLLSFFISRVFQGYIIRLTQNVFFEFEMLLINKLRRASYQKVEQMGSEKLYTAVGDIRTLSGLPEAFMQAFNSAIIIICSLVYIFFISPWGGGNILVLMVVLAAIYVVRNKIIMKDLNKIRDLENIHYRYLHDLLEGFKEIKMSRRRSNKLFERIGENRLNSKQLSIKTGIRYLTNELIGIYSWYVVLGMVLFVLPMIWKMNAADISSFIIVVLYLMGPVARLVVFFSYYSGSFIAVKRLKDFDKEIDVPDPSAATDEEVTAVTTQEFRKIQFDHVVYEYFDAKHEKTFNWGPVDFTINKGEIVFVTGGNGSGKSTFVKLFTGLYSPVRGHVYYNDDIITSQDLATYTEEISAIFTNNYLFSENYDDFDLSTSNSELGKFVQMLEMEQLIRFKSNGTIDASLSKGQQKRLALIFSLMEKRDILILDEWAAEQDPRFRAYFYKVLIHQLRAMGKTIIAITHDDEYYEYADRLIKFDYGRILEFEYSKTEKI